MADCFTCPSGQYANKDQTSCIPKAVVFLSYKDPLGISLAICALSFLLVTALVLRLFVKHHNSPIVKINNRCLTYILLISLLLCFLCPLLHIGRPDKVICILQESAFGIIFTVSSSALLAKTMTVVFAFTATRPGSTMKNWLGKRLANLIILLCTIIEVAISIIQLAVIPSSPYADMQSQIQEIILTCYQSSSTILCSELVYWAIVAIVIFIVAFLARKLPCVFNEAKFITFNMLVFFCVWLGYLPIYLTTKGKNRVAMKIVSMLATGAAQLVTMFLPKCYIILWRPQLNCREQLRMWKR